MTKTARFPWTDSTEVIATLRDGSLEIIDADTRIEVATYAADTTEEADAILAGKGVTAKVEWTAPASPDFAQPQPSAGIDTGANGGE